ncbi:MAG: hypothetical protein HY924_07375 [Elusimicrobia bacterium]|nr:hypothetical protein [Elusimicrobiota bacterium]
MVLQPGRPSLSRGARSWAAPASLCLAALLAALPARALFDAGEMDRIDTEPDLDEEYFSDLHAFSYPMEWESEWRTAASSTSSYRATGASLDCCSLLWSQELRTRWSLTERLAAFFRLEQTADKERRPFHYTIGFERGLGRGWTASIFGEPAFDKEDSDAGLGLDWAGSGWKASYRAVAVDFPLNRKAGGPERYSRQPFTQVLGLEAPAGEGRLSLRLELDSPMRREVWAELRSYSYRRTHLLVEHLGPLLGAAARLAYVLEYQHEGDFYSPDPRLRSSDYRRMTHTFHASALAALGERDSLEAGQRLILRHARNDHPHDPAGGVMYRRWEAQPYARWRRRAGSLATTELGVFLSLGENRKRYPAHLIPAVFDTIIQAKLGAGLDLRLGPKGKLGLYGAFDLDDPRHPWDGGSARAQFAF